jgi:hypothetical protein
MSREQNVPLLLWISTAILAHIATGGGAEQIARVIEDRSDLQIFARQIRGRLQPPASIEVAFEAVPSKPEEAPEAENKPQEPRPDNPTKPDSKKPEVKKPPEKVEQKKIALPSMTAAPPPPPQQPPPTDHRIAVKQHAEPDQEDNPTARFIADEANHVKEESTAQITAHDQDDPNPTPGGHHSGPQGKPGNSDHEKIGDSDDHAGDPTHGPGESARAPDTEHTQKGQVLKGEDANKASPPGLQPNPKLAGTKEPAPRVAPAPPAPASGGAGPAAPETVASDEGGYHLDPARPGENGASNNPGEGKSRLPPAPVPSSPIGMLGLGGTPNQNGINLNLTPQSVVAVVGEDKLNKERMADGERRKSAHRGSWENSSFERWRAAIENYVSSVKPGNQTALNAARSPFGTYLVTIHNRIHPIFAEDFLGSLDGLPANHPMNEPALMTRLEIVLDRDDGHVIRMGVVRTSGITAFDIAALDSVQRASPFGKPPKAIVSADGNVYFHWEFHRDPVFACSTINARPYMLNTPAPTEPTDPKHPAPTFPGTDPREQQAPPPSGSRQGFIGPTLGPAGRRKHAHPSAG